MRFFLSCSTRAACFRLLGGFHGETGCSQRVEWTQNEHPQSSIWQNGQRKRESSAQNCKKFLECVRSNLLAYDFEPSGMNCFFFSGMRIDIQTCWASAEPHRRSNEVMKRFLERVRKEMLQGYLSKISLVATNFSRNLNQTMNLHMQLNRLFKSKRSMCSIFKYCFTKASLACFSPIQMARFRHTSCKWRRFIRCQLLAGPQGKKPPACRKGSSVGACHQECFSTKGWWRCQVAQLISVERSAHIVRVSASWCRIRRSFWQI